MTLLVDCSQLAHTKAADCDEGSQVYIDSFQGVSTA